MANFEQERQLSEEEIRLRIDGDPYGYLKPLFAHDGHITTKDGFTYHLHPLVHDTWVVEAEHDFAYLTEKITGSEEIRREFLVRDNGLYEKNGQPPPPDEDPHMPFHRLVAFAHIIRNTKNHHFGKEDYKIQLSGSCQEH